MSGNKVAMLSIALMLALAPVRAVPQVAQIQVEANNCTTSTDPGYVPITSTTTTMLASVDAYSTDSSSSTSSTSTFSSTSSTSSSTSTTTADLTCYLTTTTSSCVSIPTVVGGDYSNPAVTTTTSTCVAVPTSIVTACSASSTSATASADSACYTTTVMPAPAVCPPPAYGVTPASPCTASTLSVAIPCTSTSGSASSTTVYGGDQAFMMTTSAIGEPYVTGDIPYSTASSVTTSSATATPTAPGYSEQSDKVASDAQRASTGAGMPLAVAAAGAAFWMVM
ncbi:hypothetical protein RI367_003105 [Sorochytrium milnesiophthora]